MPADLDAQVVPGVRVRVRFAGQDVDGYVLDRAEASDHQGRLAPLRRVVSAEPVLTPQVLALCRAVADRYAGTLADVLRLAVPPRHARTEKEEPLPVAVPAPDPTRGLDPWGVYPAGAALLGRLRSGDAPRAVWTAPPGPIWADAVAHATPGR